MSTEKTETTTEKTETTTESVQSERTTGAITEAVAAAAETVGKAWPLHSFVTANPLSGFEDEPFHEAVARGEALFGGRGYPEPAVFRRAVETGQIDPETLRQTLTAHGYDEDPETLLDQLEKTDAHGERTDAHSERTDAHSETAATGDTAAVERVLTKWLAAFLDQGQAEWSVPNRERGLYATVRSVARYDDEIPNRRVVTELPAEPTDAIRDLLADVPSERWPVVFEAHLAALPGWTGLVKQRAAADDDWQSAAPVTLVGYLAVRLALTAAFDAPFDPAATDALPPVSALPSAPDSGHSGDDTLTGNDGTSVDDDGTSVDDDGTSAADADLSLPAVFLRAWEATYRAELVASVAERSERAATGGVGGDTASDDTPGEDAASDDIPSEDAASDDIPGEDAASDDIPGEDAASDDIPGEDAASDDISDEKSRPDAQLVFCIDTRSEIVRRHVEAAGDYETHGYAGFFGVPMRYEGYEADATVDACPPIVDAEHYVADRPVDESGSDRTDTHDHGESHDHDEPHDHGDTPDHGEPHEHGSTHNHSERDARERYDRLSAAWEAGETVLKRLQSNAATAFSFVESAGSGYGLALAGRTLLPGRVYDLLQTTAERTPSEHEFCEPTLDRPGSTAEASTAPSREDGEGTLPRGLTLDEKVSYAASAFELMGIEEFGRLVVFVGHASQTANNPFDSSLDCGACAGNPGGPSARVLAAICNDPAVRDRLAERGIDVPADTYFLAGEHETTTDRVRLFDERVPESHATDVRQLRSDLDAAREGAATERAASMDTADVSEVADGAASGTGSATLDTRDASADETGTTSGQGVRETERRAADWAETRPEWGLAGNAAFVIGPRSLTADLDLGGRSFLHSYDWRTDPDGDALAAIVAGPLVVTQWINSQYYFASVDNAVYGSGSKITHNPVGNVAVYQGNGGDVQTGLPLQSLYASDDDPYHQPLRLSAVIHAPVDRVTDVLADHDHVVELLDNDWLSLTVVDPRQDHTPFHYDGDLTWMETTTGAQSEPETPAARPDSTVDVTADD